MRILAGDIGGTNTRLSLWSREDGAPTSTPRLVGEIAKFKNAGIDSFDATLATYLQSVPPDIVAGITDACFGVAGPIDGRKVSLTNIPHWPPIHVDAIATKLKIGDARRVTLLNDMSAHSASLASIEASAADQVINLNAGDLRPSGMRAIVMPGTGLGIGMLVWEEAAKLHRPLPTEGGHADLPARDYESRALIASAHKVFPNTLITREHLISGPGLSVIYACLKNPGAPNCAAAPAPESFGTIEARDPIAKRTLDTFTKLLGETCGNVALGCLATGGVYLAGSIATSLRTRLTTPLFSDAFISTGPPQMRELMRSMPIELVTYQETGLLGAATYACWVAERRV